MGIRETLNQNPQITTGIAAGVVLIAIGTILWQLVGGSGRPSIPTESFYTVDDGQTYVTASAMEVPPFQLDGKEAVRAHVFECDGTTFVGYLEKYTPQAVQAITQATSESATDEQRMMADNFYHTGRLVKRPGEPRWVVADSANGMEVVNVRCPGNPEESPNLVMP